MLVYYDLLSDKEVATDSFDQKDIIPGVREIISKRITVQEAEVDIGANASAEGDPEDEGVEASEAKSVINVVHACHLQKMDLSKKEYQTMQKSYWKKLLDALNKKKYQALEFPSDYEAPADKAEAKKAEEEAYNNLSVYDKKYADEVKKQISDFKENFEGYQNFVKDTVLANYDEFEFYTCEEGELGSCMLIPARYIGEATAPAFYIFMSGVRVKKE